MSNIIAACIFVKKASNATCIYCSMMARMPNLRYIKWFLDQNQEK